MSPEEVRHGPNCEAEFISGPMLWTACSCANRTVVEAGHRWTERSSHRWTTDDGWSLFYTDGPSWWLTSPDYAETDMCTRGFRVAMRAAAEHMNASRSAEQENP